MYKFPKQVQRTWEWSLGRPGSGSTTFTAATAVAAKSAVASSEGLSTPASYVSRHRSRLGRRCVERRDVQTLQTRPPGRWCSAPPWEAARPPRCSALQGPGCACPVPAGHSTVTAGGVGAAPSLPAGLLFGGARACRVRRPARGGLNAATAAAAPGVRAAAGPVSPLAVVTPLVAAGAAGDTAGAAGAATAGAAGTPGGIPGGPPAAGGAAGRLACSSGRSSCRAPQGWSSGENRPGSVAPPPPPCSSGSTLPRLHADDRASASSWGPPRQTWHT